MWDVARIQAELRWVPDVEQQSSLVLTLAHAQKRARGRGSSRSTHPAIGAALVKFNRPGVGGRREQRVRHPSLQHRAQASGTLHRRVRFAELTLCSHRTKATESLRSPTLSAPFTPARPTLSNHSASAASAKSLNVASPSHQPSRKRREACPSWKLYGVRSWRGRRRI